MKLGMRAWRAMLATIAAGTMGPLAWVATAHAAGPAPSGVTAPLANRPAAPTEVAARLETPQPMRDMAAPWMWREPAPLSPEARLGQRLYLDGVRADGSALKGLRRLGAADTPIEVSGRQAACVQCHRRSGLGAVEGDVLISPVTGRALYQPATVAAVMETRARKLLNTTHAPYTRPALGEALREGRQISGRSLHPMMPRYALDEAEVDALDAYLQTLSPRWSPGVSAQRVRIASVIAPDVDAVRRRVAVDMIGQLVSRKNLGTRPGRRHMVSTLEFVLRTERQWEHEIWELSGPPETWLAQLRQRQAANPVFAIASGVMRDASALHAFCQAEQVPCWFPVAETLPARAAEDFYGVYFSAGVALEAQVIARQLPTQRPESAERPGQRLLQLVSDDAAARQAAQVLHLLREGDATAAPMIVRADNHRAIAEALAALRPTDILALWLRPDDLAAITAFPAPAASVWLGASLSGGEHAPLSPAWRTRTAMAYPFELPWQREGNMAGLRSWLATAQLPLVDEALQSQLFFAFNFLNETTGDMLNNLHRDYLVERAESMLGRRERDTANGQMVAQRSLRQLTLDRRAADAQAVPRMDEAVPRITGTELTASREGTTIFPRLSLAPGQRFASKGAWVVRLSPEGSPQLLSRDAEWVVP